MPKSVKVGPLVYEIVRKPKALMGNDLGLCKFDQLEIWMRCRLKASKSREIVWHEITHACTHPSVNDGNLHTDEQFVENVSLALLAVIRDNPQLVEYLRN